MADDQTFQNVLIYLQTDWLLVTALQSEHSVSLCYSHIIDSFSYGGFKSIILMNSIHGLFTTPQRMDHLKVSVTAYKFYLNS